MKIVRAILLISITAISLVSHGQVVTNDSTLKQMHLIKESNRKKNAEAQIRYFIIKADVNSFGYTIYIDGNLFIQQTVMPSLQGKRGFADTLSAAKIARLVIQKIKEGEMPPTITTADLKRSGVQ